MNSLPGFDESPTYEMSVDLNVLDHLGIKLYSNVAAVLAEAVANAWDADAENVHINLNQHEDSIEISDDGVGMTVDDMNDKYLRVGYARREENEQYGDKTAKGRQVMGRKGLGKLSLFSIARIIEIRSSNDGTTHGCRLDTEAIAEAAKNRDAYHPEALQVDLQELTQGTKINLRKLKRSRLRLTAAALRKRLARRFSVIGERHQFKMFVNGEAISIAERGDLAVSQFVWTIGGHDLDQENGEHRLLTPEVEDNWSWRDSFPKLEKDTKIAATKVGDNPDWLIRGWIGTARNPQLLNNEETGNMNGIVLLARGRLFHENIAESLSDGRIYTKYITGQVNADFLDVTDDDDLATSDRQRVREDDPRVIALKKHMRKILNQVDRDWKEWRAEADVKRITETNPALEEWMTGLLNGHQNQAKRMIRHISKAHFDTEDDKKELLKHSIYAFERMALRGSTAELADSIDDPQALLKLLADQDALEAELYLDIISSRLEAIKVLTKAVDENTKEKVLQQYLFDHLWLLDPSWERAAGSKRMESRLMKEGVIIDNMSEKKKLSRVDISYKTAAGKHIIVELKRAGRVMKLPDLVAQGQTYVDKVVNLAKTEGDDNPSVEVIFVLGRRVAEQDSNPQRLKSALDSISPGSRIVNYEELIRNAKQAYLEYLEKRQEFQRAKQKN
ncbi:MAG: ATP-binding protein [Acidimicrobiaceae bacterium]|nr:ATP-binding protein [Acidimicrobiaceae bacterium]